MRGILIILGGTILLTPNVVTGASFNCSQAASKIEKIICASTPLSRLDEQLAKAYKTAVGQSANPDMVKRQQREWLRNVRDKCQDETCLRGVYEKRFAQLTAIKQVQWKTFRDSALGIKFSYPSNRKVQVGCRGSKNCVALIGKSMSGSDYLMAMEVFDGGLEKVAVEQAIFQKKDDGWIAEGRSAKHPVSPVTGNGWQGLKSLVDCGITDNTGFHAGAGECLWVVVSNGKRSVVADTQGLVGNDEASIRSIQSIQFTK